MITEFRKGHALKGPGWPDMRGWAGLGFFALEFFLLHMIEKNPALLANASFMQFAGQITTGGVLLLGAFLFGGTKSGAETNAKLAATIAPATPTPGSAGDAPPR